MQPIRRVSPGGMQYENCSGRLQNTVNELMHMQEMSMKKKGSSRIGLFGEIKHYDEKGRKIGESRPTMFGGYNEYDAKGRKVGEIKHYDKRGRKTGESKWSLFGDLNHYDQKGKKIGHSERGIFGDWKDYEK